MTSKTLTFDDAAYKLVPIAETPEWRATLTEFGYSHNSVIGCVVKTAPCDLPGVVAHSGSPAAWLVPHRGVFNTESKATQEWKFNGCRKDEEPQALFTHPPAQPDTAFLEQKLALAIRADSAKAWVIAELELKLEVDQEHKYDGIDCRDATIEALEAHSKTDQIEINILRHSMALNNRHIAELQARIVELEASLHRAEMVIYMPRKESK